MLPLAYSPCLLPAPTTTNPNHPLLIWGRKNEKPTIMALAKFLGISHPRLSQIVTRKHRPSTNLALQIVRMTEGGVELGELLEVTPTEAAAKVVAGWEKKPATKRRRRARRS